MTATVTPIVDVSDIYIPDELCWVFDEIEPGDPIAECWRREGDRPLAYIIRMQNGWLAGPINGDLLARVGFGVTPAAAWTKAI